MPDSETERLGQFKSEYYYAARRHMVEQPRLNKDGADLAMEAVDALHQQVGERMVRWKSTSEPGTSEIHTSVSVLKILQTKGRGNVSERARQVDMASIDTEQWFVFSATPNNLFPTDGGPLTAFDIALDRALRAMPAVRRSIDAGSPKDVQITMMGSPFSLGGQLTPDWVEKVVRESFYVAQAKLHAEYLVQRFSNTIETIYLTGQSMGALMAMITARFLPEEMQNRVKVLADNPDPTYGDKAGSKSNFWKMLSGLAKEAGALWERREDVLAKAWIGNEQKRMMRHAGVWVDEDKRQKELKKIGLAETWKDLEAGPGAFLESFYPERAQVYIRQGIYDKTRVTKQELQSFLENEETRQSGGSPWLRPDGRKNVRQWGFEGGHGMRRHHYDTRWVKSAATALRE